MKMYLWEILVPTARNDGRPIRTRFHRIWDKKVREIAGGLTIFHPVKGEWIAKCGTLYAERMIPVRIACDESQMQSIADLTAKHYDQLAVMFYKVSDDVRVVHYASV